MILYFKNNKIKNIKLIITLILFIEYYIYYYILLLSNNIFIYINVLWARSTPDFILYYSFSNILYKIQYAI